MSLPFDASGHGHQVDALLHYAHAVDGVLAVALLTWLLVACVRFGPRARASPSPGSRRSVAGVLVASLVIFAVLDVALFVRAWRYLDEVLWNRGVSLDPAALRIEVNAQQWSWAARYAGPDSAFNTADDAVVLNDIRVPVGRPVLFQLGATDVIHSFSLPNFRTKLDAVPGQIGRLWIEPRVPGRYDIVCAQLCGVSHYKMKGTLTVLAPAEFDAWLAEASVQGRREYDPADEAAHWGWPWRDLR